ncbi:MAG: hypothetical protein Q9157_000849 [Trypethelium eluteriae]
MTTKGFDDLLDFLLIEVAFRGLQGASIADFTRLVEAFYKESNEDDARDNDGSNVVIPANLGADRELLRKVWAWLTSHPDISVGRDGQCDGFSYDQIEQRAINVKQAQQAKNSGTTNKPTSSASKNSTSQAHASDFAQDLDLIPAIEAHESPSLPQDQSGDVLNLSGSNDATRTSLLSESDNNAKADRDDVRLYASQERMWRALASHDVDWRRVPKMEFDLLSIIAASGSKGILQSALVQSSGQDKRSVPQRTDRLHANGYIIKTRVMANSNHTSLCRHIRFAQTDGNETGDKFSERAETHAILEDGVVFYGQLFKRLFSLLRTHSNIMTLQDLRQSLGIQSSSQQTKLFYRAATRLEKLGCLQRVKAKPSNGPSAERHLRCLKLLREPDDEDYRRFVSFGKKQDKSNREPNQDLELIQDQHDDLDDLFADEDDIEIARIPPQWTPDVPHANFLFNLVHSGGADGVVSAYIRLRALGVFWKRGLDVSLGRLSDAWELTQPQHLRHLAIIRDTVQVPKGSQYVYRSYSNFQKAADAGQTEWEAVMSPKTSLVSTTESTRDPAAIVPSLEDLGFSDIPGNQFASSRGTATLSECESQAKIQRQGVTPNDPILKISEEGDVGIKWGSKGPFIKSRHWSQSDVRGKFPRAPPKAPRKRREVISSNKKLGRPRIPNGPTSRKEARARAAAKAAAAKDAGKDSRLEHEETASSSGSKRKSDEVYHEKGKRALKRPRIAESSHQSDADVPIPQESPSNVVPEITLPTSSRSHTRTNPSLVQAKQPTDEQSTRKRKRSTGRDSSPGLIQVEQSNSLNPKVLINPLGSERPAKKRGRGRPPKSLMIVIQINRLRRADWSVIFDANNAVDPPSSRRFITQEDNDIFNVVGEDLSSPMGDTTPLSEEIPDIGTPGAPESAFDQKTPPVTVKKRSFDAPSRHLTAERPVCPGKSQITNGMAQSPVNPAVRAAPRPSTAGVHVLLHAGPVEPLPNFMQNIQNPQGSHDQMTQSADQVLPQHNLPKSSSDVEMVDSGSMPADVQGRPQTHTANESGTNFNTGTNGGSFVESADFNAEDQLSPSHGLGADQSVSIEKQNLNERHSSPNGSLEKDTSRQLFSYRASSAGLEGRSTGQHAAPNSDNAPDVLHNSTHKENSDSIQGPEPNEKNSLQQDLRMRNNTSNSERTSETVNDVLNSPFKKRGVDISGGFVGFSRARTIIWIIEQAGGVFPGGNAMWYPFVTAWGDNRDGPQLDRRTLNRAVNNLVSRGRIRKFTFSFQDENGGIVTRHVLTLPEEDPQSRKVREIQKRMSDAHPFQFLPPGVEVSKELKESMKRTLRGSLESGASNKLYSRIHLRANAALGNDQRSDSVGSRESVDSNPRDQQTSQQSVGSHENVSKSLVTNPYKSPGARFSIDDSVTVHRLYPPEVSRSSTSRPIRQTSAGSPTQAQASVRGSRRGRPRSSKSSRVSALGSRYEHDLHRKTLDRLHSRVMNRTSGPPFLSPTVSGNIQLDVTENKSRVNESPNDGSLVFVNQGPANFDPDYAWTRVFSIFDPDQSFYENTGTFSTEGSVLRHARFDLWRELDTQDAFELQMPYDIHDMVSRGSRLTKHTKPIEDRGDPTYARLNQELRCVRKWEERTVSDEGWEQGFGDRKLRFVRFINYQVPHFSSVRNPKYTLIAWDHQESEHFTSQDFSSAPASRRNRSSNFTAETPLLSGLRKLYDTTVDPLVHESPSQSSSQLPNTPDPAPNAQLRCRPTRTQAIHGTAGVLIPQWEPKAAPVKRASRGRRRNNLPQTSISRPHFSPTEEGSGVVVIDQKPSVSLDTVEKKTLILAVAVVRSLTSGAQQEEVQWGLVAQACGYMRDGLTLRRCWTSYHRKSKAMTDRFQERFQLRFAQAYEEGEIPELDFSNLEDFDWAWLLGWARKVCAQEDHPVEPESLYQLPPGGRNALAPTCDISEVSNDATLFSEKYFVPASVNLRDALVNRSVFLAPLKTSNPAGPSTSELRRRYTPTSDLEVARSWIRANCLTPNATFNGQHASEKLRKLTERTISTALEDMLSDKVLRQVKKDRIRPGRNYDLTDVFLASFRRPLEMKNFLEAAKYKERLDAAFQDFDDEDVGDESSLTGLVISPFAEDGEVLAILNLLASGSVRLVPQLPPVTSDIKAPDPKLCTWGFTAPGYQTAQMDRKKLRFDLEIHPTSNYVFGNPIKEQLADRNVRTPPVPSTGDGKAPIPLWYDINGECMAETWSMVLVAILVTLISRPSADVDTIVSCCKGNLEMWEVLLCLEWCEAAGALQRVGSGWTTTEWWWLAFADGLGADVVET